MELIRTLILSIGWPILIVGSIYLTLVALRFHRDVGKTVLGKLVLAMVIGWFVSMYSLGITATIFMLSNLYQGVVVVLPIFFIWFVTMIIITWVVLRWSKEAVTLSAFYRGLEALVKQRTEELKVAYEKQLETEKEVRKLRERFVFVAAHELKTPVTAVEWGLSTILEDKKLQDILPDDYRTLLENLRQKNKKLIELVSDLLSIARIQTGTLKFETETVHFNEALAEIQEIIEIEAKKKGVTLSWPILTMNLPPVQASRIYLKDVLNNLLMNAIRYNKQGGWVKVKAETRPDAVIVHVRDSGIGMSKEEMQKLFQEFYRIRNRETKNIEGTGLGLFITKQLLEQMHGKISIESEKGQGSTFTFSLPLAKTGYAQNNFSP